MAEIKLQTAKFALTLAETGVILSIAATGGENILSDDGHHFAEITGDDGSTIPLSGLTFDGAVLTETFADGTVAHVAVEADVDFLRFRLLDVSRTDFFKIAFVSVPVYTDRADCGACVAVKINCKPVEYPGINALLQLEAYPKVSMGVTDAAGCIACAARENLRDALKSIVRSIKKGDMPVNELGGPFALDHKEEGACRAYTILPEALNLEQAAVFADKMREFGLTQVNLHPGYGMYAHGSFEPNPDVYKDRAGFQKLVDLFHSRGIQVFLHTYTFFIGHNSSYVTPVPHPDLGTVAEFTLARDMDEGGDADIVVRESVADVDPHAGYKVPGSAILWIDDELVGFTDTDKCHTFTGCKRGFDNTRPSAHKAGARVRILLGYFLVLAPRAESELFYEIARKTAEFYNSTGADGFYLDAIDGVFILGGNDYAWYHSMLFLREMFAHLDHPPVFDCCYGPQYPSTWLLRSRMGTLDAPTRGYRDFVDVHVDYCRKNAESRFLIPSIGWKNIYPGEPNIVGDMDAAKGVTHRVTLGWQSKLWTPEDIEYLCVKGLSIDACMSYHNRFQFTEKYPILKTYAKIMARYDEIRAKYSFSGELKKALSEPRQEFHLTTASGEPHFIRRKTVRVHIGDDDAVICNPFKAQSPRIRLETLLTADYDDANGKILCEGTEFERDSGERLHVHHFEERLNTNGLTAFGVEVEGDGSGALLCIRIRNDFAMKSASSEHFIPLNFTGKRRFVMWESENCERDTSEWHRTELEYKVFTDVERFYDIYGNEVNFKNLDCVEFEVNRPCNVKIGDVRMMRNLTQTFKRPTLSCGDSFVTFDTALASGTFLEYTPGKATAEVYDLAGHLLSEPAAIGGLKLDAGENSIHFSCENELTYPCRAAVTAILDGETVL